MLILQYKVKTFSKQCTHFNMHAKKFRKSNKISYKTLDDQGCTTEIIAIANPARIIHLLELDPVFKIMQ